MAGACDLVMIQNYAYAAFMSVFPYSCTIWSSWFLI